MSDGILTFGALQMYSQLTQETLLVVVLHRNIQNIYQQRSMAAAAATQLISSGSLLKTTSDLHYGT